MKHNSLTKGIALTLCAVLVMTGFSGCSKKSESEKTVTVKVKSVNEKEITAVVGTMSTADPSQGGGQMPQGTMSADGSGTGNTPPEMPQGTMPADGGGAGNTPPEMPQGTMPADGGGAGNTPPEMPQGTMSADGSGTGNTPPEMPQGGNAPGGMGQNSFTETDETVTFTITDDTTITLESQNTEGTIDNITVDSILEVTIGSDNSATKVIIKNSQGGMGGNGGPQGSTEVTNGTAANTISEDKEVSGETYSSTGDDENALRVDGAKVTLDGIRIEKIEGDSSNTENGDFYGQNAGLLALNGSNVTIKNATINTLVTNGNGVFSYGEGTTVNISDSKIVTSGNNSGGIQTTGGGTTNAENLDIQTYGNSAAAIRSDRGGGNVNVTGGKYVTNGTGSPAIYSTAAISVSDATLTATSSEGVVVEGQNSVALKNCDVTGNMKGTYNDGTENIHGIMIYQSMSGDAEVGNASFSMEGGSLTTKTGDLIYVTNTKCNITLKDVDITLANDNILCVEGNESSRGWGTSGANGGEVTFTADNQVLEGNITVDSISSLDMTMKNGTKFTGTINGNGAAGTVNITINSDTTWTLTGDAYVTTFNGELSSVNTNGHHLYVNGEVAK